MQSIPERAEGGLIQARSMRACDLRLPGRHGAAGAGGRQAFLRGNTALQVRLGLRRLRLCRVGRLGFCFRLRCGLAGRLLLGSLGLRFGLRFPLRLRGILPGLVRLLLCGRCGMLARAAS